MRVSNVALLTLAALASQNVTAQTNAAPAAPPISGETPQASNFVDAINNTVSRPAESMSAPETIADEQFSPRIAVKSQTGLLVAAAGAELSPAVKTKANPAARATDELTQSLQETWLAKLIETGVKSSPQVRDAFDFFSPRTGSAETGYGFNNTITLLNILLILGTILPPVTIAFFWAIRRLVVKQLVADANQRLHGIGVLESELLLDFLTRETELSKSSVEQIETLKSQFIMRLQVLVTEVDEKKSQIVQEISQVPAIVAKEAVKLAPQRQLNNAQTSATAPASDGQNLIADDCIKQVEELYFQGNYNEALACVEKAILTNKNADEAWYWRANVLIRLQRHEEAIASYDQAILIKPDHYEAWYNKANLLGKLQRCEEAIACYERASASEPRKYGCWHSIAALLGKLQHYEEAIASYDRALAIKTTDSEIWHNRGAMLGKVQQYAAAVDSYDRALELNPKRYETWYNRGNMLWRLLRYADSVASYDRALDIRADKYEVWYNRGAVLGKMQLHQEAIASYDKAIAIKPQDFEVWHNRGAAFDKLSQHEAAIASYSQAITLNSKCYEAWFGKGESLAKLQHHEEAIAAYEKAIAIQPESYDAWHHCGTALSQLKRYEEAMAAYDRAIAIKPENAEAWRDRGTIASELKQDTEGFAAGEKDTQNQPQVDESSES
ncbi:MAG: tetratricopeptide repeat protein [Oscillatoriales cyanobacterium]|nr:MAG: tetratricopeptide repeat protein [Oscillatoriales cyanobacterium]